MLNSKILVGVSVTPGLGLEVAVTDFMSRTVLKYGFRQLEYDYNRREIADLDIFREALQDLFIELQIPKNAEICMNIPSVIFRVNDYQAALNEYQIIGAIEDELSEHYVLRDVDPAIAAMPLPSASTQLTKIAYTAASRAMLIEIALIIKDLGYKLYSVDTSVNSTLNALIYKEKVDVSSDSWVLVVIENSVCRVLLMNKHYYVDALEEHISIGEVLDESENYVTVINTLQPILKQVPAKYLYLVSKTDIISAEVLASKLKYSSPIIPFEANIYSKEQMLNCASSVDENVAKRMSIDVVGASVYKQLERHTGLRLNLFNRYLGDVYLAEQPPEIDFLGKKFVLSAGNLIGWFIGIFIIVAALVAFGAFYLQSKINVQQDKIDDLDIKIQSVTKFLKENEDISSNLFDEGDEIRIGLVHNKKIYSYYTIVGTEIPKKLWLTSLNFGENVTINGQADNLESVYSFFRSVKDYDPSSKVKLQKLGLASSSKLQPLTDLGDLETDLSLTSMNADYYEFRISDGKEEAAKGNGKDKKSKNKKKAK